MKCPFCNSSCSVSQKKISADNCIPLFKYYFYCSDRNDCGWSGQFMLEYLGSKSPSQKGIIDEEKQKIILCDNPLFKNGFLKPLNDDKKAESA